MDSDSFGRKVSYFPCFDLVGLLLNSCWRLSNFSYLSYVVLKCLIFRFELFIIRVHAL